MTGNFGNANTRIAHLRQWINATWQHTKGSTLRLLTTSVDIVKRNLNTLSNANSMRRPSMENNHRKWYTSKLWEKKQQCNMTLSGSWKQLFRVLTNRTLFKNFTVRCASPTVKLFCVFSINQSNTVLNVMVWCVLKCHSLMCHTGCETTLSSKY